MAFIKSILTTSPILRESVCVPNNAHGAQCSFFGVVRNRNRGRDVVAITYEAHAALCEAVFSRILDEVAAKYEALDALLVHRTGRLVVGDISVAIAASSVHRDEAFAACREIIEAVKHEAPIWKQEHFVDGDSDWVQGHSLCR